MRESLSSLESERTRLAESKSQLSRLSSDIGKLESQQKTLIARRGQLQGSLQRIEELERQITQQTQELRRIREEQAIYEELRVAFGREGVQALLIDTILPQIEAEANHLLARMTEGRMHVKLESQRPLQSRKGQFAETLEIKVSDELGHRSYEMFSGGESFRINLALRIALSKVLGQPQWRTPSNPLHRRRLRHPGLRWQRANPGRPIHPRAGLQVHHRHHPPRRA